VNPLDQKINIVDFAGNIDVQAFFKYKNRYKFPTF